MKFRLTQHPGVVQCRTDPELEEHLCADGNDPGLSVEFIEKCIGESIRLLRSDVQTFRGNRYVPYSVIVERAKVIPELGCLLP